MSKTEQKACLSTSSPQAQAPTPPSSSPEPELETDAHRDGGDETLPPPVPPKLDSIAPPHESHKPDYVLALCYILVYLQIAWLIIMVLRSYSRD